MAVYEISFKVQSEFSEQSTTKKFSQQKKKIHKDNHYDNIHESVRPYCRVH